jgi:hypothetical protein
MLNLNTKCLQFLFLNDPFRRVCPSIFIDIMLALVFSETIFIIDPGEQEQRQESRDRKGGRHHQELEVLK